MSGIINELTSSGKRVSSLKPDDYDTLLAKYLKASAEEKEQFKTNETNTIVLNTIKGLRSNAIWTYKTSEQIGEKVLAYDPIPGIQKGCVSLEEATGGKAWSL